MNEFTKKWVVALRSGKYKQGKGVLRNEKDEFCCLGVACDLYIKEFGGDAWQRCSAGQGIYKFLADGADPIAFLAPSVRDRLGLASLSGKYYMELGGSSLIIINDDGWSFKKIADLIESEPDGLFATEESRTIVSTEKGDEHHG